MAERDSATCEDVFDIKHSHDWRNVSVYRYGLLLDPPSRRLDYDSFECATCSFYCSDIRFRKRRVRRAIAGIGVTSEAEGGPVESVSISAAKRGGALEHQAYRSFESPLASPKQSDEFHLSSPNRGSKGHKSSLSMQHPFAVNGPRLSDSDGYTVQRGRPKKRRITD